jgi:hypothetical protein
MHRAPTDRGYARVDTVGEQRVYEAHLAAFEHNHAALLGHLEGAGDARPQRPLEQLERRL